MIRADQPRIFGSSVIVGLSSKADGNLKFGFTDDDGALSNRRKFLDAVGIDITHTSLVGITYETSDFTKYRIATVSDKSVGMLRANMTEHVDALVVCEPNHALFLPLADCAGVVLYDPIQRVLMVSHLGRHSVEQDGGRKSVEYLQQTCDVRAGDLLVWVSPSVGKATYPLRAFDGKSLQEAIAMQLHDAGVLPSHVEMSQIDTAHDQNYYSHSEYLKGNQTEQGRFAIVAQMTGQGEPAI